MTSKDIQILCNYTESTNPVNPSTKLMYIDMNTEMDESYLREIRKKNRDLAIDAVLDDKIEEYNNRDHSLYPEFDSSFGSGHTPTISPKIYSIGLSNPNKFESHDEIWNKLIDIIDSNTKKPHSFLLTNSISQLQYQKDNTISDLENSKKFSRKMLSRIMMISNMIASSLSRIGPATFMIVGSDIVPIIEEFLTEFTDRSSISENKNIIGSISEITVVVSNKIKSNKVIIARSEQKQDHGGLIVMSDKNNYYIMETPHTFYKKFAWFEVI